MKKNLTNLISVLMMVVIFSAVAFSQTTEFVYQGQLRNSSAPASGSFDFEFLLFDTLAGPNQVGPTLTQTSVNVANGLFSVKLDFGSNYPGADRFLEIHVRQTGGGSFTPLTPRQRVASAPYSVRSINAATADTVSAGSITGVLGTSQGGTGIGPALPVAGTYLRSNGAGWTADGINASDIPGGNANYIQNSVSQQPSSNFNVSGNGTAGGTLSGQNVNASFEYRLAGQRFLSSVSSNSAFGTETGAPNFGQANTYVGYRTGTAGTSNTSNNSFFGANAGRSNSNGNNNAFFGEGSGELNTFGGFNTFFGTNSGAANVSGNRNTFIGVTAGLNSTQGDDNTFVGGLAGQGNLSGASNSFVGSASGISTTTGSSNSFFGDHAGQSNTTGTFNSAFGAGANIGGGGNLSFATALGSGAIASSSNTVVVGRAVDTVQVPGNLTVTGTFTGTANIFNVTTQYNIGGNRVFSVAGTDNVFAGVNAGGSCTACNQSTIFGKNAGFTTTNGPNNAFFGFNAGIGTVNGGNAFFGSQAGQANTTGTSNTAIGFGTDVGGNLNFATAIGASAVVTQSNSVVLGTTSASVGIGTTAPKAKLHVAGGSVYIANPNSLIITSPNGACWFITVGNTGVLSTISVACP